MVHWQTDMLHLGQTQTSPGSAANTTRGSDHTTCTGGTGAMATPIVPARCDLCKDKAPLVVYKTRPQLRDLVSGTRYQHLTIRHFFGRFTTDAGNRTVLWCCVCECGKHVLTTSCELLSGRRKSCGCFKEAAQRVAVTTHGKSYTFLYRRWTGMLSRCMNPHAPMYKHYGGRGITVCERWRHSFAAFAEDMGEPPRRSMQIERIDTNGQYSKENCRWATIIEQANNKRNNRFLIHDGITLSLTQWARRLRMHEETLRSRLRRGLSVEDALTTPVNRRGRR